MQVQCHPLAPIRSPELLLTSLAGSRNSDWSTLNVIKSSSAQSPSSFFSLNGPPTPKYFLWALYQLHWRDQVHEILHLACEANIHVLCDFFFTRAVNFSERKRVQKAHIALIQLVRVSEITVRMFYFLGQES